MARVSVILVTFNRPALLKKAIESVFRQTELDWEMILVNNGSPLREIEEICEQTAEADTQRVRYYETKQDIPNLAVVWNRGVDLSTGQYVCTLDDDNEKEPGHFQKMADWLDAHPAYYSVACQATLVENDKVIGSYKPFRMSPQDVGGRPYVDSGCMMYRRGLIDRIGYYNEWCNIFEDFEFTLRQQWMTPKGFGVVPENLLLYRWHNANRSHEVVNLGRQKVLDYIYSQKYINELDVLLLHSNSFTPVISGRIKEALRRVFYVNLDECLAEDFYSRNLASQYDLVFVLSPYLIDVEVLREVSRVGKEVVHFNIDDPYGVEKNLERTEWATFVYTNNRVAGDYYNDILNRRFGIKHDFYQRVSLCNSLGAQTEQRIWDDKIGKVVNYTRSIRFNQVI